jgi:uncharacterized caspase-like protein
LRDLLEPARGGYNGEVFWAASRDGIMEKVGTARRARRLLLSLGSFWFLLLIAAAPATADKRVALVVGNSAYRNVTPLDNPKNDAKLMAETLRGLGFTLIGGAAQIDLDKPGIDRVVQSFGAQLRGAEVGLFYYAGHGVQVRGANFLVPIDANPTSEADVDFQMLDTNLVLRQMEVAGTRLNLVILDACRNNPFGGRGLRATSGGLAQMQAPEGTLISYATQPGNVARDGADGNSPYTKALTETIRRAGLDVFQTFNEVGLAVKRSTGGAQLPWVSSSPIDGSFYFAAPPTVSGAPAAGTPPSTTTPPPAAAKQTAVAAIQPGATPSAPASARPTPPVAPQPSLADAAQAWTATKDTTSPAVLQAFAKRYANTIYGEMARARLKELQAASPKPADKVATANPGEMPTSVHLATPSLTGKWQVEGDDNPFAEGVADIVQSASGALTMVVVFKRGSGSSNHYAGNVIRDRVTLQTDTAIGPARWDLIVQNQPGAALRMEGIKHGSLAGQEKIVLTKMQ